MTLKLNIVNLAWEPVSGSSSYDILLDGVKVAQAGPRAKTTKINIPEGAEHKVTIKAQPSGQVQEAKFEWASVSVVPPPPPPAGNPYLNVTFPNRRYSPATITVFESYTVDSRIAPSWGGLPAADYDNYGMSSDTNQRVCLVAPPVSYPQTWVSRQEVRTTDGPWCTGFTQYDKSTFRGDTAQTINGTFTQGIERWFRYDYLLPLNLSGETFNYPTSGHLTLMDLHETVEYQPYQTWNVLDLGTVRPWGSTHPKWLGMDAQALGNNNPLGYDYERFDYLQLTDAGGSRVSASYNAWHTLIAGIKFSSNTDGWVELWHDGVNVLPRHNRRTCFPSSTGVWWQAQVYKMHAAALAGGATSTVVYFGNIRAGMTKADVN